MAIENVMMREPLSITSRGRADISAQTLRERQFYVAAAFAMLIVTLVGFRDFLLHGKAVGGVPMTRQILGLVVIHGLAMLGWVGLFCIQSSLILTNRRRLHISLGKVGAALAGVIVILGLAIAPLSVHFNPASYADVGGARYFLALILPEPVTFGVLVAVALIYRSRPGVHRPMMLLATLALMTGPLDRVPYWDALVHLLNGSIAVAMFGQMLVVGAIFLVVHTLMTGRVSRFFVAGYGSLALVSIISTLVAHSTAWNRVAGLVTK